MVVAKFKVLIAGSGLGGLCLAQSLRRFNVAVEVFERDAGPWERPQGYRLHVDSDGITALAASLTPQLLRLVDLTSMRAAPFTTIVDPALAVKRKLPGDELPDIFGVETTLPEHVNVDRATLRQILLTGLDDVVHYNRAVVDYQEHAHGGVTVTLSDGTQAHGDVLVGADGIRSTVRAKRAPSAQTQDSGVRAIYGRLPMSAARNLVPDHVLEDVFTVAVDPSTLFLGLGPVVFPTRPDQAAAQVMPEAALTAREDYLVCIVGGRHELFADDDATLGRRSSSELQQICLDLMKDWPDSTQAVLRAADSQAFFAVHMYTGVPCELPASQSVTLLGDAIHAMTPTLGRGANVAMRDGALLGRYLGKASAGQHDVQAAIAGYESEMTGYGFTVVRESAAVGARLVGQNPLP